MTNLIASYVRRLNGALTLDIAAYEEIEADGRATTQACVTVLLSSVAAGIGAGGGDGGAVHIASFAGIALMAWASWALLTFEVGARILPGARTRADVGELLRTTGFAATPGLFLVLGVVPGVAVPLFAVVAIWILMAMIVAVRQALDYTSTGRAVAVCATAWALAIALAMGAGFFLGTPVS